MLAKAVVHPGQSRKPVYHSFRPFGRISYIIFSPYGYQPVRPPRGWERAALPYRFDAREAFYVGLAGTIT